MWLTQKCLGVWVYCLILSWRALRFAGVWGTFLPVPRRKGSSNVQQRGLGDNFKRLQGWLAIFFHPAHLVRKRIRFIRLNLNSQVLLVKGNVYFFQAGQVERQNPTSPQCKSDQKLSNSDRLVLRLLPRLWSLHNGCSVNLHKSCHICNNPIGCWQSHR